MTVRRKRGKGIKLAGEGKRRKTRSIKGRGFMGDTLKNMAPDVAGMLFSELAKLAVKKGMSKYGFSTS